VHSGCWTDHLLDLDSAASHRRHRYLGTHTTICTTTTAAGGHIGSGHAASMETEQHQGQENEFGTSQWVEMGGYSGSQQQSPLHEYGGFGFVSPTIMPVEPSYSMSIPPPYTSHQQLQPLIMPVPHVWPSMMTSQANYSAPLLPTTSASAPTSAISAPPLPPMPPIETKPTTTPRKTLTNEDRRRMCLYHEEHPGVKQTEIGCKAPKLLGCVNHR
jgi:hypothetical protein